MERLDDRVETEEGKGHAATDVVLKKVNKFKFDLFSWICGGSSGLNR